MKDFSQYSNSPDEMLSQGDRIAQLLRQANQQTQPDPARPAMSGIFASIAHAADTSKGAYDAGSAAYDEGMKQNRQQWDDQINREAKVYEYLSKAKDLGDQEHGKIKEGLDLLVGPDPAKQQQVIGYVMDKYPDQKWDSSNFLRPTIEAIDALGISNEAARKMSVTSRKDEADIGLKNAQIGAANAKAKAGPKNEYMAALQRKSGTDDAATLTDSRNTISKAPKAIADLDKALAINKLAPSGITADAQSFISRNNPYDKEKKDAVYGTELNRILSEEALNSLKEIFGGNPTEGERKILLALQGTSKMSVQEREALILRTKAAVENRVNIAKQNQSRVEAAARGQSAMPVAGAPQQTNWDGSSPAGTPQEEIDDIAAGMDGGENYQEGQTATNPDTGEQMIFTNGVWEGL